MPETVSDFCRTSELIHFSLRSLSYSDAILPFKEVNVVQSYSLLSSNSTEGQRVREDV